MRAFRQLYDLLSGFVYSVAIRITRNETDAQEVTQDVFVKLHQHIRKYEGRSAFKTWVYRMSINQAIDLCKKRSRQTERNSKLTFSMNVFMGEPEAKRRLFQQESEQRLNELLECLNEDQRACILLREIEGLNYQQIADILKININTVRSRLKRAREAIIVFAREKKEVQNELRPT